jgi:ankyrin repeat protein
MVMASDRDRIDHARLLIKFGTSIDSRNRGGKGITALMRGAPYENAEDVQSILDLGADPDLTDSQGNTALMIATAAANHKAIGVLTEAGANLEIRNADNHTALMIAVTRDHYSDKDGAEALRTVELLLKAGPKLDVRNRHGEDALFLAVQRDSRKPHVEELIRRGADLQTMNNNGVDLLMLAAQNADPEQVANFLKLGLSPTRLSKSGETSVHYAAKASGPYRGISDEKDEDEVNFDQQVVDVLKQLHQAGAPLTGADEGGLTPLHLAANSRKHPAVAYLLPFFERWDLPDQNGMTPLHHAASDGCLESVELLLPGYEEVEIRDSLKRTPLWLALENEHTAVILRLKEAGADIDTSPGDGINGLSVALENERYEMARFLIDHGADTRSLKRLGPLLSRAARRFHDHPTTDKDYAIATSSPRCSSLVLRSTNDSPTNAHR